MSPFGEFIIKTFHFTEVSSIEQRKRVMAFEVVLWTILGGIFYCILYAAFGNLIAALVTMIYIVLSFGNMYYYYVSRNYKNFRLFQLVIILLLPITEQFVQGGYTESGAVGIAAFFAPLGALIFLDFKNARKVFYAFLGLLFLVSILEWFKGEASYMVSRRFSIVIFTFVSFAVLSIVYFLLESFVKKLDKAREQLRNEKTKSESLLLNILPLSVANELKESGLSKAKGFSSATVVFTDFVEFSKSAQSLTPRNLVKQLDVYFRAFDSIMEKYNLEKIKTIGDAYLYAGGVPIEISSHAEDAISAALEIQEEVAKIEASGVVSMPYKLRIGIHTGPLVAGVVGKKKFAYDIWGDTVNIAARIEQNGISGKVLISAQTHRLAKGLFNCVSHGELEIKNMGKIEVFSVESKIEN